MELFQQGYFCLFHQSQNIQKGDYGYLFCHMSELGEWTAFADYFEITSPEQSGAQDDDSNYSRIYGLADVYWSSSQADTSAICVDFFGGFIDIDDVDNDYYVRLGATF